MTKDQNRALIRQQIHIVQKVAVIISESGLIRNWYSDVVPNLENLQPVDSSSHLIRDKYEFTSFSRPNLSSLFDRSSNDYIGNFDALFVSTNSTNDDEVYDILAQNVETIETFLTSGGGLFVGSQKKISGQVTKDEISPVGGGPSGFLPAPWTYDLKRRAGRNSSSGVIEVSNVNDVLLAGKDKETVEDETNRICMENPFKPHKFRSHIVLENGSLFEDVLVDQTSQTSTNFTGENDEAEDPPVRKLLVRCKNKKIVYSSIAIDYENHQFLLSNVLEYITKGTPDVAFVGSTYGGELLDDDFRYLYLNARVKKTALSEIESLDTKLLNDDNRVIVVSSLFSENVVKEFWAELTNGTSKFANYPLRLLHLGDGRGTSNIVTEYTNFSEIDFILLTAFGWLKCNYVSHAGTSTIDRNVGGALYWGTDFWITHDVLSFLYLSHKQGGEAYRECYSNYVSDYFLEIAENHYRIDGDDHELGSYDGMLNCSSALLESFCIFDIEGLKRENATLQILNARKTFEYIQKCLQSPSDHLSESQTAIISLNIIRRYNVCPDFMEPFFNTMGDANGFFSIVHSIIEKRIVSSFGFEGRLHMIEGPVIDDQYKSISEAQLCKDIEILCIRLSAEASGVDFTSFDGIQTSKTELIDQILCNHLRALMRLQKNGCWVSVARTASLLKTLARCVAFESIETSLSLNAQIQIQHAIMISSNFLISKFGTNGQGAWQGDALPTANAAHALCLHDMQSKRMMGSLLDSIVYSKNTVESTELAKDIATSLSRVEAQYDSQAHELRRTREERDVLLKDIQETRLTLQTFEETSTTLVDGMQLKYSLRTQLFLWLTVSCLIMVVVETYGLAAVLGQPTSIIALVSLILGAAVGEIVALFRGAATNFETSRPISMHLYRRLKATDREAGL